MGCQCSKLSNPESTTNLVESVKPEQASNVAPETSVTASDAQPVQQTMPAVIDAPKPVETVVSQTAAVDSVNSAADATPNPAMARAGTKYEDASEDASSAPQANDPYYSAESDEPTEQPKAAEDTKKPEEAKPKKQNARPKKKKNKSK